MIKTVKAPHILLPRKGVDMSKYAVIACDQYTSNLEYWNSLKAEVGDSVSTFHMIYPEAYLENTDNDEYIKSKYIYMLFLTKTADLTFLCKFDIICRY